MLALADARLVSAAQTAYRRKIEMDIEPLRRGASGITIQHRTADIEAASKPWKDDLSASQIARRFGVSPNVIAGIAFRNRALFSSKPRARNCRPHESSAEGQDCNARPQARYHNHPSPQV